MTELLFRDDAYLREAAASVEAVETLEDGTRAVRLDRTVFYPTGGGQPGDSGTLRWEGGETRIATARKGPEDSVLHILAEGAEVPSPGTAVAGLIDWETRHRHMRVHTALHLLSVVLEYPVTGGSISAEKGRLDFDMAEAPGDKGAVEAALMALVDADHAVTTEWITDAELDANPGLVKTMAVQPPRGQGRVRLVRIGTGEATVDLQPCGGTHVASTAEIGRLTLGKIEKKGRENRRVTVLLA